MFTGSTEVARMIQAQLAERLSSSGKPIPLIAETGGQNAMLVVIRRIGAIISRLMARKISAAVNREMASDRKKTLRE